MSAPTRRQKICSHPGCDEKTTAGKCPDHQVKAKARRYANRESPSLRGYDAHHKRWREAILARDFALCVECGGSGDGLPMHADHIVPLSQGGAVYDMDNGQTLCHRCHSVKTVTENGGFGR